MPAEIRVPPLGESIVEATVARWLKKEGEAVAAGEPLVELETDKVNVEVASQEPGVLSKIDRPEGESVAIGDLLGQVSAGDGALSSVSVPAASVPGSSEASPPSASSGGPAGVNAAPADIPAEATRNGESQRAEPLASPLARRMAAESHLDLHEVKGTGPSGRIVKEDVAATIEHRHASLGPSGAPNVRAPDLAVAAPQAKPSAPAAAAASTGTASSTRPEERVRMTRRRQTIARRLVDAQRTAAILTTFNEIDMSAVMEIRKRRKDSFRERHGIGLGFMSFFTRAAIGALKAYPYLNAEIQEDEIVLKRYYDIGVAVSTEEGLVVPVVRDADRKSFAEIETSIADLATRARDGKLTLPELQGGTFTITNGGIFGSLMSTPILNAPEVGILGMHKIEERPVARDGQVVIRPMMYVALSYDHRIVDGGVAVRFLVRVKELIEDPESLLLEG